MYIKNCIGSRPGAKTSLRLSLCGCRRGGGSQTPGGYPSWSCSSRAAVSFTQGKFSPCILIGHEIWLTSPSPIGASQQSSCLRNPLNNPHPVTEIDGGPNRGPRLTWQMLQGCESPWFSPGTAPNRPNLFVLAASQRPEVEQEPRYFYRDGSSSDIILAGWVILFADWLSPLAMREHAPREEISLERVWSPESVEIGISLNHLWLVSIAGRPPPGSR